MAICPGPNLAYFKRTFSLDEMVGHIYGKQDVLKNAARPHMFLKELELYMDYLLKDFQQNLFTLTDKKRNQLTKFKDQLLNGIDYYKTLFKQIQSLPDNVKEQLQAFEEILRRPLFDLHVTSF